MGAVIAFFQLIVTLILGWLSRYIFHKVTKWRRSELQKFFTLKEEDSLKLILSLAPHEHTRTADGGEVPSVYKYDQCFLAGPNEVEFLLDIFYPSLQKLLPFGKKSEVHFYTTEIGPGFTPSELSDDLRKSNLIIVGSGLYNKVTELVQQALKEKLMFLSPGGKIIVREPGAPPLEPEIDLTTGRVKTDYGLITKVWNPFDISKKKVVFILAGIMAYSVLGINELLKSEEKVKELRKKVKDREFFELLLKVDVAEGRPTGVSVEKAYTIRQTIF